MGNFKRLLSNVFLWKYERGSLAYDIIVVLILLFIFLVPRSCFERKAKPQPAAAPTPHVQSRLVP
jgi:hypothetical protein